MKRIVLSFIVCFGLLSQVTGQKRISGRSVPVQFSMVESPLESEGSGSSLKEHYMILFRWHLMRHGKLNWFPVILKHY